MINMKSIYIFLYLISFINISYGQIFSWRFNNTPSLLLTDQIGLMESNNSLMIDKSRNKHMLRIEDIVTESGNYFSHFFVNFEKKRFTSYVIVKMYDTFSDELITEFKFYESGSSYLNNRGVKSDRIYLIAEVFGEDVELRVVGVEIQTSIIAYEDDIMISTNIIHQQKDTLDIDLDLQEEAAIFIYIYNENGDICTRIVDNNILNSGKYQFIWNPRSVYKQKMGDTYYLWFKATNLRSQNIEYVKDFYMIP